MANIAFFQHRLGETDGVSLQVDKWHRLLKSGEARHPDYKRDWIGLAASTIFVIVFLACVEAPGRHF